MTPLAELFDRLEGPRCGRVYRFATRERSGCLTVHEGHPSRMCSGYDDNGMFVWFSYVKPFVRLHVRPPVLENHQSELKGTSER